MKFDTWTNSNIQKSMAMFTFYVFDRKYPFLANLVQNVKIISLSWNLVASLIQICKNSVMLFKQWVCVNRCIKNVPWGWRRWLIHLYSVIRLKIQVYLCKKCCKQECSKEALSWYNFNPKGIIIFPYNDKQIILLTSMRNNNPGL